MPDQFGTHDMDQRYPSDGHHPARRGMPWWDWLIIVLMAVVVLPCVGCVGWVFYIGSVGPDTGVYTGNEVPANFVDTARDVGALEADETILYFYSDALSDIRNGFYFISDQRSAHRDLQRVRQRRPVDSDRVRPDRGPEPGARHLVHHRQPDLS